MKNIEYIRICFQTAAGCTAFLLLIKILTGLFTPLIAVYTARVVDSIHRCIIEETGTFAVKPAVTAAAIMVAHYVLNSLYALLSLKLNAVLHITLDSRFAEHIAQLKYTYIEHDAWYNVIERVGADYAGTIQNGFYNIMNILALVIKLGGLLTMLASSSIVAAGAVLLFCVPVYYTSVKSGNRSYTAYSVSVPHKRRYNYFLALLNDRFYSAERLLFNYSPEISKRFHCEYAAARKLNFQADKQAFIDAKTLSLLFTLFVIACSFVMLIPLSKGTISGGTFTALFITLSNMIHVLSWQLQELLLSYEKHKRYLEDLATFYTFEKEKNIQVPPDVSFLQTPFQSLQFKNVSFAYPESDQLVLCNFSLTILPHTQYALVGKNGCGKTTVIKLLAGLYNDYSGEILLNGKNIRDYTSAERKACFSFLFQDYAQYHITAAEHMFIADAAAHTEKMKEYFQLTGMLEKLCSFPLQFNTPLGKLEANAEELSKGQWQRVALARCFAKPAHMFVLDEPTASLDPFAENKLYTVISNHSAQKRMTTLYSTHRLAAARNADEIIVMDKGSVVEKGCHDELIMQAGLYAALFKKQQQWYSNFAGKFSPCQNHEMES